MAKQQAIHPATFRQKLLVPTSEGNRPLASVVDDWQQADFTSLDPAWLRVCGYQAPAGAPNRAWLERPRGHSKTADVAAMVTWALAFSRRPLVGVVAAGDEKQAGFLRDAIKRLVDCNKPLRGLIDVQAKRVLCGRTNSKIEVITSDALTAFGEIPDFVICDEVTHWKTRALWDAMFSSAGKKAHCLLIAITNAGWRESWQWRLRKSIKNRPNWHFSALPGPVASWITEAALEEQRVGLTPLVFDRVWLNQWTSGAGDAISADDLQAALVLPGVPTDRKGYVFIGGLDLGLTRDAAAFVVVGRHVGHSEQIEPDRPALPRHLAVLADAGLADAPPQEAETIFHAGSGKFRLFAVRVWEPKAVGGKVSIGEIEDEILLLNRQFGISVTGYDPWQAEYLAQRLRAASWRMEQVPFTPSNLQRMATAAIQGFRDRNVELFDDEKLTADLGNLQAVEKSYGVRLEPGKGQDGEGTRHGDAAMAFSIAMAVGQDVGRGVSRLNRPLLCWPAA